MLLIQCLRLTLNALSDALRSAHRVLLAVLVAALLLPAAALADSAISAASLLYLAGSSLRAPTNASNTASLSPAGPSRPSRTAPSCRN